MQVAQMSQKIRDAVGTLLLQLTLKELFEWRFMQTDPNWGNFLYDEAGGKLNLIDFGAAREFPVKFVDDYLSMVKACAEKDRDGVIDYSTRLGFLTGQPEWPWLIQAACLMIRVQQQCCILMPHFWTTASDPEYPKARLRMLWTWDWQFVSYDSFETRWSP